MSRRPAPRSACLDPVIVDYVHGTLSSAHQLVAERHLVVCLACRAAVETERRLDAALRGPAPEVPHDLHRMLMSMAPSGVQSTPGVPSTSGIRTASLAGAHRSRGPAVPPPPRAIRALGAPLPVMDVRAPAQHRSAMRSAICAGLAAGASAAAAWSIGMSGSPVVPISPAVGGVGVTPVSRPAPGVGTHSGTLGPRAAMTVFTVPRETIVRPAVSTGSTGSAQSTP